MVIYNESSLNFRLKSNITALVKLHEISRKDEGQWFMEEIYSTRNLQLQDTIGIYLFYKHCTWSHLISELLIYIRNVLLHVETLVDANQMGHLFTCGINTGSSTCFLLQLFHLNKMLDPCSSICSNWETISTMLPTVDCFMFGKMA